MMRDLRHIRSIDERLYCSVIAAAVGAVGSVAGGVIGANAAGKAANAQVQASNNALNFQNHVFDTTHGDLAGYNTGGQGAFNALLGQTIGQGTGPNPTADWSAYLANNPDVAQYYDANKAQLAASGITSPMQWAQVHYQANGQQEGRALPQLSASQLPGAGLPGGGQPSGPTGGVLNNPLLAPYATNAPTYSPYDQAVPQYTPFNMTQAELEKTPGYQFNLTQGLKAVQNAAAARGLGVSGAAFKGAANFATGLADSTYQNQFANYVTNYQNRLQGQQAGLGQHVTDYTNNLNNWLTNYNAYTGQQGNQFSRLMGVAGLGENAAAQSGNLATTQSGNIANTITGIGNAQAGGIVGSANAISGGIGGATGGIGNSLILNQLLRNSAPGRTTDIYSNPLVMAPNTLQSPALYNGGLNSAIPDMTLGGG